MKILVSEGSVNSVKHLGQFARPIDPAALAIAALLCFSIHSNLVGADAVYRLELHNTWSTTTHPGLFPDEAHFSWLGGGTHSERVSFWSEGAAASPGMKQMAETGVIDKFVVEVEQAVSDGDAFESLAYRWWFCPEETVVASCGQDTVDFELDIQHPQVTLVTMLGPSPDWFVGVSGLQLRESGAWLEEVVVELFPYDGGTRSNNAWLLGGPENMPPAPIQSITDANTHLVGPDSLGRMTFTLLSDNSPPPSPLDCNLDDDVDLGDLTCVTSPHLGDTLDELNLLPGDFDGIDGVAFPDFLVLAGHFGMDVASYADGDADLNGTVQFADFLVLSRNFGQTRIPVAVPEPGGLLLLVVGLLFVLPRRQLR